MAEKTTSYFLNEAVSRFRDGEISFIYKYVDDFIGAIKRYIDEVQRVIVSLHTGMKLKVQLEDEENEVVYLQTKIGRDLVNGNSIHVRWHQKDYCAKRILDFHAFHQWQMKDNVVKEFVKSALQLSSTQHWKYVIRNLRKTLRNSNYPNQYIDAKITVCLKESR